MIQIITYDVNKYKEYSDKLYTISKLGEIQALDDFEVCIIDLCNKELWKYVGGNTTCINAYKDLLTLKEAILHCKKCRILVVFPQNIEFWYKREYVSNGRYEYKNFAKLKDIQKYILDILKNYLINLKFISITYEKTTTMLGKTKILADFNLLNFRESGFEPITFSINSNKVTTVKNSKYIVTTLNILEDEEILKKFIREYCKNENQKQEIPEWIQEVNFFDDEELKENKNKNLTKIRKLNTLNAEIDIKVKKNLEYKSILYTNGDELVKIVLEILDEILEYDSSEFVDEKREDFLIKKKDVTFVGEIKGLSSSVKNENVSQLDVHVQSYLDDLQQEETEEKVKGLLIINHQRNKPIEERQEVHEHQIKLATRNESLIIETTTLLKIYEKYKLGDMTKEECKKLFKDNIGLLKI